MFGIDSSFRFYQIIIDHTPLVPQNTEHRLSAKAIRSYSRCGWCAWVYAGFFALGILKINPLLNSWTMLYDMMQNDFFLYRASKMSHIFMRFYICLSFNSWGTHLLVFWIFPISRCRLETSCLLTSNCSTSCFCACKIFIQQCLQFHIFEFFVFFLVPCLCYCLVSKSRLLKRRNHRSHVSCDEACSP